ncbi:MAG: hypothetical protein HFJ12_01400 [Bacilli bacterium]|nr:hypothetical protein [Bacilli bacterium]
MFERRKQRKRERHNTLELQLMDELSKAHENSKKDEKLIKAQEKLIQVQEDNDIYQKYIIEELEKDVEKIKQKYKKLKEERTLAKVR